MYLRHWNLRDKPFRNTPDPRYLFPAPAHEEALARALYAVVENQGAMALTGEVGCGKTLLLRTLLAELDPAKFEAVHVAFPNLAPDDFLRELLRGFGFRPDGWDRSALRRALARFLARVAARGGAAVVVVDEAQTVADPATWEEIRLLLNHQRERGFALTLLLAGQPELDAILAVQSPLAQRLAVRAYVGPLLPAETEAYFAHRLTTAGGSPELFTEDARARLFDASGGIPRRLNHLADLALLAGFGARADRVDEAMVARIVDEPLRAAPRARAAALPG